MLKTPEHAVAEMLRQIHILKGDAYLVAKGAISVETYNNTLEEFADFFGPILHGNVKLQLEQLEETKQKITELKSKMRSVMNLITQTSGCPSPIFPGIKVIASDLIPNDTVVVSTANKNELLKMGINSINSVEGRDRPDDEGF